MALILNIDTATETASVSLAENGIELARITNNDQKDHASFLQPSIKNLFESLNLKLNELDAVAVSNGPGSYTGLRVGLASAKGICYALNKPLIAINTLEAMASGAMKYAMENSMDKEIFFCPMIDARRKEVYTALYDYNIENIVPPCAMILSESSFDDILSKNKILFFGSGTIKFRLLKNHTRAIFIDSGLITPSMAPLAFRYYLDNKVKHLVFTEPFYLKGFFIPPKGITY